ncbi:preprotein translocase subunit SecE [Chloroflexota bacterium]
MTQRMVSAKQSRPRFRYFTEIINELKKVVWLNRRETAYLTAMVLVVSVIFGIILGALDFAFSELINALFFGG